MELTKEQLEFLKRLSNGERLREDSLGDLMNYLYPEIEKDVEAKRQCEEMFKEGYLTSNGFTYEITEKGMDALRERNLLK